MLKTMPFALTNLYVDRIQKDPNNKRNELWFIFSGSKLLIDSQSMQPFQAENLPLTRILYMGVFKEFDVFTGEMLFLKQPLGSVWEDLKTLYGRIDDAFFGLAGKAMQLILWDRTHQFCGQCGKKTSERLDERAKECLSCNLLTYPKICPVMMVLIRKGDEILLARGLNPVGFYSALAGFVEAGETLENCIEREVFEEVGLTVNNIQYFGSQSWPFPNSLIIAFTCEWNSGEITIDPSEIIDAQWFKKDTLPLLPPKFSISRILIDSIINDL